MTAIRLANGFGAPQQADVDRWTLVTNDLCRQAVVNGRMTLQSSGHQLRNFITLEDVARAVDHLLTLAPDACGDGVFNLGSEKSRSILTMAELIVSRCPQILGRTVPLDRPTAEPDEVIVPLDYDVTRLLKTGFTLTNRFEAEIDATLRLCRHAFGRAVEA